MSLKKKILKEARNLFPDDHEAIAALISPAIGISLKSKAPKPGLSKIGGYPDTPPGFSWPLSGEDPLMFLCQINLNELAGRQSVLPQKGMLYFFTATATESAYPAVAQKFKVLYEPDASSLSSHENSTYPTLDEREIAFFEHYTVPSYQERVMLELGFDLDELKEIVNEMTTGSSRDPHHLLGDPDAVQGAVRPLWASHMMNPDDLYYEKLDADPGKFYDAGDDFILLLQINLEDESISLPGYGDSCLYLGIAKSDLEQRTFDNVQLVIQGT